MKVLLRIHGRVQAVGYRAWTVDEAAQRGLNGWVRNRQDGTVEALLDGTEADVSGMIAACRTGPAAANVREIEVKTADAAVGDRFMARATV